MKFKEIKDRWMETDQNLIDDWNSSWHARGIEERISFEGYRTLIMVRTLKDILDKLAENEEKDNSKPV